MGRKWRERVGLGRERRGGKGKEGTGGGRKEKILPPPLSRGQIPATPLIVFVYRPTGWQTATGNTTEHNYTVIE